MSSTISVGELKADFSHVLEEVQQYGKKYVIEYGRKHKKVAMLVPYEEEKPKRQLGILQGKGSYNVDNWDFSEEELDELFYNAPIFPDEK
jgi:antitoxin (DNA-binding transcriptional repressor) of toxin-antitoxin stability system